MSYKGLFKGMKKHVQMEADEIIQAAEKEADQIIQQAQAQVERIQKGEEDEDIIGKRKRIRRRTAQKSKTREVFLLSQWDAKVQYQLFEEVVQQAKRQLATVRNQQNYPDILARLISEAVQECEGCDTITIHEKDVNLVKKIANKHNLQQKVVGVSNFSGGAIATAHQGKIKVDNTLDARIEQAIPLVITEIGKILYGSKETQA